MMIPVSLPLPSTPPSPPSRPPSHAMCDSTTCMCDKDCDPMEEYPFAHDMDEKHQQLVLVYAMGGHAPLVSMYGKPSTALGKLMLYLMHIVSRFFNDGDNTWSALEYGGGSPSWDGGKTASGLKRDFDKGRFNHDSIPDEVKTFFKDSWRKYKAQETMEEAAEEADIDYTPTPDFDEADLKRIAELLLEAASTHHPYEWSDEAETEKRNHLKSLKRKRLQDETADLQRTVEDANKRIEANKRAIADLA